MRADGGPEAPRRRPGTGSVFTDRTARGLPAPSPPASPPKPPRGLTQVTAAAPRGKRHALSAAQSFLPEVSSISRLFPKHSWDGLVRVREGFPGSWSHRAYWLVNPSPGLHWKCRQLSVTGTYVSESRARGRGVSSASPEAAREDPPGLAAPTLLGWQVAVFCPSSHRLPPRVSVQTPPLGTETRHAGAGPPQRLSLPPRILTDPLPDKLLFTALGARAPASLGGRHSAVPVKETSRRGSAGQVSPRKSLQTVATAGLNKTPS